MVSLGAIFILRTPLHPYVLIRNIKNKDGPLVLNQNQFSTNIELILKRQKTPLVFLLEPISVCKLFGPLSFPHVIFHYYFFFLKRRK